LVYLLITYKFSYHFNLIINIDKCDEGLNARHNEENDQVQVIASLGGSENIEDCESVGHTTSIKIVTKASLAFFINIGRHKYKRAMQREVDW
jgi:hypothetical protein